MVSTRILNVIHEHLPKTKLHAQKNPCMGYNRQAISSCIYGVVSPTRKLKAQFVAVDNDTPFARTLRGIIYRVVRNGDKRNSSITNFRGV